VTTPKLAFDPVIHAPARLQIVAVLAGVQDAEFALLRKTADVSDSVLSKHLSALAEAGYVKLRKAAQDGRQRTWASITRTGRAALTGHVAALKELAGMAEAPVPQPEPEPVLSPNSA
jgi:DNA-binding transcriptional ArsR family regulator